MAKGKKFRARYVMIWVKFYTALLGIIKENKMPAIKEAKLVVLWL